MMPADSPPPGTTPPREMPVSELARRAGITTATINYYVRLGVLPRPKKTSLTRAVYGAQHLKRIGRIKDLQQQGMPLKLIRGLFAGELRLPGNEREAAPGPANEAEDQPPRGPVTPEQFLKLTGLSAGLYNRLTAAGVIRPARRQTGDLTGHTRRDVVAGRAIARLAEAGVPAAVIEKHREFQPVSGAEAHFLAEHLVAADKADVPDVTPSSVVSAFDALRRYLRHAELEASYRHWFERD